MFTFQNQSVDYIIDVRSKLEFLLGHVQGAINLPVQSIARDIARRPEIAKDAAIVLCCRSGHRAGLAQQILRDLGYTRVLNGGSQAQLRAGLS